MFSSGKLTFDLFFVLTENDEATLLLRSAQSVVVGCFILLLFDFLRAVLPTFISSGRVKPSCLSYNARERRRWYLRSLSGRGEVDFFRAFVDYKSFLIFHGLSGIIILYPIGVLQSNLFVA